jgi:undecaprenyl-diphosphatase
MGVNERYLERSGLTRGEAVSAVIVVSATGLVVHSILLVAAAIALNRHGFSTTPLPRHGDELLLVLGVLLGLGVVVGGPLRQHRLVAAAVRHRLVPAAVREGARQAWAGLASMARDPWRVSQLLLSSVCVTAASIAALAASLHACGAHVAIVDVATVYLAGTALAAASPTPGGLGAVEAALVAGLAHFGGQAGPVVAGVLTFRFFTYWLPALPGFVAFRYLQRRGVL